MPKEKYKIFYLEEIIRLKLVINTKPHERLRGAITRKMGVETGKFFEYWVKTQKGAEIRRNSVELGPDFSIIPWSFMSLI
jgi:hypothetical protein